MWAPLLCKIENWAELEVPPLGDGLTTVTLALELDPLTTRSEAGTWAVNCVALT
jgi:hypothetical protein